MELGPEDVGCRIGGTTGAVVFRRGGGGAPFSVLDSALLLCLRRSTTGTAKAAVVNASYISLL